MPKAGTPAFFNGLAKAVESGQSAWCNSYRIGRVIVVGNRLLSMPASSPANLSPGYLLRNFRRVADWVLALYADILSDSDHQFHQTFDALPEPARHLYLRLLTRTRPLISVDSLNYQEVPDTAASLAILVELGFAELNPEVESAVLLSLLTRTNLLQWFGISAKAGAKKSDIADTILQQFSNDDIHRIIAHHQPYTRPLRQEHFQRLLLLFFGNGRQDLSEFIITELGHVRYESYRIDNQTRYFQSREDVDTLQRYLQIREALEDADIRADCTKLLEYQAQLTYPCGQPELQRRFDRILLDIARQLERLQALDEAFHLYSQVETHPSRERRARILANRQQIPEALTLCRRILEDSHHPEELEFAEQFGSRLARKSGADFSLVTPIRVEDFTLTLPFTGDAVEILAAQALTDADHQCVYVENTLFCGLFGLLFWDIVYAPIPGAFFHPFQRGPKYLHTEFFYTDRKTLIDARLDEMNGANWQRWIWQHFDSRYGTANAMVVWELLSQELIDLALQKIPASHLHSIFRRLASHPGLYSSGFPDLIRFSADGYELIEVKAPNDRLQPNQRRWFRHFAQAGIPARLLNVTWSDSEI